MRGNVVKVAEPGGLVTKTEYDGAARVSKRYVTDGGGDSSYADALTVTGDKVLEQTEYAYDDNGNVTFVTHRQRFHDETDTGALGTPRPRLGLASTLRPRGRPRKAEAGG